MIKGQDQILIANKIKILDRDKMPFKDLAK